MTFRPDATAVQAALGQRDLGGTPPWSLARFHKLTEGLTAGEKLDLFLDLDEPCRHFLWEEIQSDSGRRASA